MTTWTLVLRDLVGERVDASSMRLADWIDKTPKDVGNTQLTVGYQTVPVSDLFTIKKQASREQHLIIEGDLNNFDRIGDGHDLGTLRVLGTVGNHVGAGMTGGQLLIEGNAGDHLAAPFGTARLGMRGGRIKVSGNASDYTGHRMRRGEVFIEGDVGRFTASQMIAGTILVAGNIGDDTATGMRRGTVITRRLPELPERRFSSPLTTRSVFPSLIRVTTNGSESDLNLPRATQLVAELSSGRFVSRRGDRAVLGKGELLAPNRSDAL